MTAIQNKYDYITASKMWGAAINGYGSRMSMSAPVPGQKNP